MRLIDAHALRNVLNLDIQNSSPLCKVIMGRALLYIDEAPTIEAEPVKHGELWVSCSERMPEMLTETLDGRYSDCCLVFAEETEWIGMAYYRTNNSESWWEFADAQNKPKIDWAEITHWMPLPNCPNCGAKMDGEE